MGEIADDHQSYIADEIERLDASGELYEYMLGFEYGQRLERERMAQAKADAAMERRIKQRALEQGPPPF